MIEKTDFTEEMIKETITASNETELFIRSSLYLEYIINKTIEKKFSLPEKTLDHHDFTLNLKMQILADHGYLVDPYYKNAKMIVRIRNRYAHSLKSDEQSIENMIYELEKIPAMSIDEKGIDKFTRFKGITLGTILELMSALKFDRPLFVKPKTS